MTRYVLVPGGWHGGWAFDVVGSLLSGEGHEVEALTLAGLDPLADDKPTPAINLDRHIEQAVAALNAHDTPAVLVGHSYGGMVVTGAADRVASRVQAIVYADAYVPDDGDSVWSLTTQTYRDRFIAGASADGLNCAAPGHLDPRCRPHPFATFLQAICLTGRWRDVRRKAFVCATGWEGSPFVALHERLSRDPAWSTHRLPCAHDIPRLAPEAFTKLLLSLG